MPRRRPDAEKAAPNKRLAEKVLIGVCDDLLSLTEAADRAGVPRRTVRSWIERDASFALAFRAACDVRTEGLFEKLTRRAAQATEVAAEAERAGLNPNAAVGALRVECENLRWALSKLAPARYGDRVQLAGDPDQPLIPEAVEPPRIAAALLALLASAKDRAPQPPATIEHATPQEAPPLLSGRVDGELRCVGVDDQQQALVRLVQPIGPVEQSPDPAASIAHEQRLHRLADARQRADDRARRSSYRSDQRH
jgi:hypothetical protein